MWCLCLMQNHCGIFVLLEILIHSRYFIINLNWWACNNITSHHVFLHCGFSKGSVIVKYQLLLKKEHTPTELAEIMTNTLKDNDTMLGSFKVGNAKFSGKRIWNIGLICLHVGYDVALYVNVSYCKKNNRNGSTFIE